MDQPNSSVATFNFTSTGFQPPASWVSGSLVPALMLSLCFLLGVPGNIAVIILRPNWQHLSCLTQRLLLNLAVSDLLCLLTLPPWIYNLIYGWRFGQILCKLLSGLAYCSMYGSQLTTTALSIQRYLIVVHRQRCHQVQKRLLPMLLWLVAFILSVPSLVVRKLKLDHQRTLCTPQYSSDSQWMAVLLTEIVVGLIVFCLVTFPYIHLNRMVNQAAFFNNPQTNRLITSIIVCLFVLWVPYHAINILGVVAICLNNKSLLNFCKHTWNLVGAVTFLNSCLNPLLYAFTSCKMFSVCQENHSRSSEFPQQQISPTSDITTTAEP